MATIRDPHDLSLGSVSAVTDVLTVEYNETSVPIQSRADDNVLDTIAEMGGGSMNGSITLRDHIQAQLIARKTDATLGFSVKVPGGAADKTYSITGVSTGGVQHSIARDGASVFVVPFVAVSADGTTSPLTAA